ncbi:hypothetical protein C0Q70_07232 [Pomacea canaliculata]|uniref:Uncharacterized protein n=1 Tax=Pomacea canaliculata TaxID=400727 RepID=A0A2T7PEG5_POMCA|nr:hypothetical protein C0Q70_07232 [Pomacea canaliculata]
MIPRYTLQTDALTPAPLSYFRINQCTCCYRSYRNLARVDSNTKTINGDCGISCVCRSVVLIWNYASKGSSAQPPELATAPAVDDGAEGDADEVGPQKQLVHDSRGWRHALLRDETNSAQTEDQKEWR